jgi:hypothetical protein
VAAVKIVFKNNGKPVSACHQTEIGIQREVHDTVVYEARKFVDGVLYVQFTKVYEGEADAYEVTCTECNEPLDDDIEVEEA